MATPSPAASEGKGGKDEYDAGVHRSSSSGEEAAELIDPAQEKKLLRKMYAVAAVVLTQNAASASADCPVHLVITRDAYLMP